MRNLDQLIDTLARDVHPVAPHAVARRLGVGMIAGVIVVAVLIGSVLGYRSDLPDAMGGYPFWVKWVFTISLTGFAIVAICALARPDAGRMGWLWIIAAPAGVLAMTGMVEMAQAPPQEWRAMWLGNSWRSCSTTILLLSIPIFCGLVWALRRLAPTRLRAAGAVAGMTAGALAATLYSLHCAEVSAIYVLTWYSLGIGLATLLGALIGPRLMRW